jgi:hypothetical protein
VPAPAKADRAQVPEPGPGKEGGVRNAGRLYLQAWYSRKRLVVIPDRRRPAERIGHTSPKSASASHLAQREGPSWGRFPLGTRGRCQSDSSTGPSSSSLSALSNQL